MSKWKERKLVEAVCSCGHKQLISKSDMFSVICNSCLNAGCFKEIKE